METRRKQHKVLKTAILASLCVCFSWPSAWAGVFVHDMVIPRAEHVLLQVETKGRFFPLGGERVEIFVNATSLGTTLSGGDGIAYKPFAPTAPGLYAIQAHRGQETGTGVVLALHPNTAIVLVDVEGSLLNNLVLREPFPGSQSALQTISKNYPNVFLRTGLLWMDAIKEWIRKHRYLQAPVLPWDDGAVFDDMAGKGIAVKAFICGANLVDAAVGRAEVIFSFNAAEGSVWATSWQEIADCLNPSVRKDKAGHGKCP